MRLPLFLFLFLSLSQIKGQKTWQLEECINQALSSNLQVLNSELNVEQTDISLDLAKAARHPNLNGNTNVFWNFGRTVDPTSNEFITKTFFSNNYGLNSGIVVFNGFRIKNNIAKAELDQSAAKYDLEQTKDDITLNVCAAFLNAVLAKENIGLAQNQKEVSTQQIDRVTKLINAGSLPAGDKLNLEAQLAQSEQAIIVAQNGLDIALLQLKQLIRLNPNESLDLEVPANITSETDPELISFEELYNQAIKNRHDLNAAQLKTESAELAIDIAKANLYPNINFGGNLATNYSNQALEIIGEQKEIFTQEFIINGMPVSIGQEVDRPITDLASFTTQLDNFLSYGFGFSANIPIYNNKQIKGSIQRAKLNYQAQELATQQLTDALGNTLQQALGDARSAKKKLHASEKTVEAQRLALENVSKRIELGVANSFEWESKNTDLQIAESNYLFDKYDYLFKIKVIEFYLGKPIKI